MEWDRYGNTQSERYCSTRRILQKFWRAREPLIRPQQSEREGYVPNVVYTCGAMRHNELIVMPYAVSDTFSNFATTKIAALMDIMEG